MSEGPPARRVIFFDIDATLIRTGGVGQRAMLEAARQLHGPRFSIDGITFSGRLDPLLLEEMLKINGRAHDPGAVLAVYERYREVLGRLLEEPVSPGALPGVMGLLDALRARRGAVLGLLTGNYQETGSMKLRACGIRPEWFGLHVWGGDSARTPPSRDDLPCIGFERFRAKFGQAIEPERVTIVGDTPLDVRCARANGCRSLGVATGQYAASVLRDAGADHVVDNLADTRGLVRWLLEEA